MKIAVVIGLFVLTLSSLASATDFINSLQSQIISATVEYTSDFELNLEKIFKENVTFTYSLVSQSNLCHIREGFLDRNSTPITAPRQNIDNEIIVRLGDNVYIFSLQSDSGQRLVSIESYSIQRKKDSDQIVQKGQPLIVNLNDTALKKAIVVESAILLFGQSECHVFQETSGNLAYITSHNATNSTILDVISYMSSGYLILADNQITLQNVTVKGPSITFSNASHYNISIQSSDNQPLQIDSCDDTTYFLAGGGTLSILSIRPGAVNVSNLGNLAFNSTIKQIQRAQRTLLILTETALLQYLILDSCSDLRLAKSFSANSLNITSLNSFSIVPGSSEDKYFSLFDQNSQKLFYFKHSLLNGGDSSYYENLSLPDNMLQSISQETRIDGLLSQVEYLWLTKNGLNYLRRNYIPATVFCAVHSETKPIEALPTILSIAGTSRFCSAKIYNFTSFTSRFSNQSSVSYTNNIYFNPNKLCKREALIQLRPIAPPPSANDSEPINLPMHKKTIVIVLGVALAVVLCIVFCVLLCKKLDGYVEEVDEEQPASKFAPHLRYDVQEDPPSDVSNIQNATNATMIGKNGQSKQQGPDTTTSPGAVVLTTNTSVTMQNYQKKKHLTIKIPKI